MKFLYFEKLETNKLYLENLKQVFRIKTNCHHHLAVAIKSRSTGGVVSPRLLPYRPTNHSLPFVWLKTPGILLWKKAVSPFSFKMKKIGLLFFSSYIKKCIQHHLRVNHTRKKHVKHSLLFFCWIFFPILCAKNVNELFAPSASLTQFQKKKKTNQKFPSRKRYTSKWRQPSIFHSFFFTK